jgi:WD40 repeat protein
MTSNHTPGSEGLLLLPADVIGQNVGSFLDRQSFNSLRLTCREVLQSMEQLSRPWPSIRLQVGKLGIQSMEFSSDGSTLACRGRGGIIRVWNRNQGKQVEWVTRSPFCFGNLTFSPDSKILACDGNDKSLQLFNVSDGTCVQCFKGHQGAITSVDFSPRDENIVASGSTDSTIRLWNRSNGNCQKILSRHHGVVYSIAFSPNGQLLASGGTDRVVLVWNLETNACQQLHGHDLVIVSVAFSQDLLVSASLDMTIRLWDVPNQSCIRTLQLDSEALNMSFSPDGNLLAVGKSDEKISLWDLEEKAPLSKTFSGRLVSFGPQTMATTGKGGFVQLHAH